MAKKKNRSQAMMGNKNAWKRGQSKLTVEVLVWGIEVEETQKFEDGTGSGWYKFEYSLRVNGGKKKLGQEDGSWSSQTKEHFQRALRNGYAARKVVESRF